MTPALFYIIPIIVVLGIITFTFSGGAVLYSTLMIRKNIATYGKNKKNQSSKFSQKSLFGQSETFLTQHLYDPLLADSIKSARTRWEALRTAGKIERVAIEGYKHMALVGDLCLTSEQTPCIALLVHGYTDSASGLAYLSEEYLKRGIGVLAVNCRAHGDSDGQVVGMGYPDSRDLVCWMHFVRTRFGENVQIILHGVSMGAAAVMLFTAHKEGLPEKLSVVVADCGFSTLPEQLLNQARLLLGNGIIQRCIGRMLIFGMSVLNFFVNGFFFFQDAPVKALKERQSSPAGDVPLLLFHGSNDMLVLATMQEKLQQAAGDRNVFVERVEGAPHTGSYFYAPERYMQRIFSVLAMEKEN